TLPWRCLVRCQLLAVPSRGHASGDWPALETHYYKHLPAPLMRLRETGILENVGTLKICSARMLSFGQAGLRLSSRMRGWANKQLQRTVTGRRGRGASASFNCALAPRWTRGH